MTDIKQGPAIGVRATAAALSLCAGLAAPAVPAGAIVRGERIAAADAPWAVSLQDPRGEGAAGSGHYCSGTAIGPRAVLTARHCVDWERAHASVVMTGSDDPAKAPGPKLRIARTWVPGVLGATGAALERYGDVAVLETTGDLGVPALPLVAAGTVLPADTPVIAYGYGRVSLLDSPSGETALLRRAAMRMYSREQCSESDLAPQSWGLCARPDDGPGGGLVASGDSGGGLVHIGPQGPEIVGVSSTATSGPMRDSVSGFASVAVLRAFVADPRSGVELPRPTGVPRVRGVARVGGRVRCDARFAPRPQRVEVAWFAVRGRSVRALRSGAGALTIPATARGTRVSCVATGWIGADNPAQSERSRSLLVRRSSSRRNVAGPAGRERT
jgi:hypothetical protein